MTGSVAGIRRRRTVAGRRETPHLPPDRDFYGQTLISGAKTTKGKERRSGRQERFWRDSARGRAAELSRANGGGVQKE